MPSVCTRVHVHACLPRQGPPSALSPEDLSLLVKVGARSDMGALWQWGWAGLVRGFVVRAESPLCPATRRHAVHPGGDWPGVRVIEINPQ